MVSDKLWHNKTVYKLYFQIFKFDITLQFFQCVGFIVLTKLLVSKISLHICILRAQVCVPFKPSDPCEQCS